MTAALSIRGLRVEYPLEDGRVVAAVDGLDLEIAQGEIHALVGESGAGKTTVGNALMGLLDAPGRVAAGTVAIAAQCRFPHGPGAACAGAMWGRSPRPDDDLNPSSDVESQIGERCAPSRLDPLRSPRTLDSARRRHPSRAARRPSAQLSGGQRRAVVLAAACRAIPHAGRRATTASIFRCKRRSSISCVRWCASGACVLLHAQYGRGRRDRRTASRHARGKSSNASRRCLTRQARLRARLVRPFRAIDKRSRASPRSRRTRRGRKPRATICARATCARAEKVPTPFEVATSRSNTGRAACWASAARAHSARSTTCRSRSSAAKSSASSASPAAARRRSPTPWPALCARPQAPFVLRAKRSATSGRARCAVPCRWCSRTRMRR